MIIPAISLLSVCRVDDRVGSNGGDRAQPGALRALADPGFFNSAGLFVLMGAEFLAMVLVVVYVGAVAVLFLFVVMMLDINFQNLRQGRANTPCWRHYRVDLAAELIS